MTVTINSNSRSNNGKEVFLQMLGKLILSIEPEHRFHAKRKWVFDYYIQTSKIAIEIEGAVFAGGRHTRGVGFIADTDKYNTATVAGICVYRISTSDFSKPDRIKEHVTAIYNLHTRRARVLLNDWALDDHVYQPRTKAKKVHKTKRTAPAPMRVR